MGARIILEASWKPLGSQPARSTAVPPQLGDLMRYTSRVIMLEGGMSSVGGGTIEAFDIEV